MKKSKKKFIVLLICLFSISLVGNIYLIYHQSVSTKEEVKSSSNFSEKEKEITEKLLAKEQELSEKEKEIQTKEQEHNLALKEFEKEKKDFLEEKAKENNYSKVLEKKSKEYQELVGILLNTDKSSMYKNVTKISKSLEDLGNDIALLEDSQWTKETLVRLDNLEESLKTIKQFDSEKVTSKHKASYEELLKSVSLYEKAIKNIKDGIDKKEISKVVTGSTDIADGAKRFQIAINIYNSEIS